MLYATLTSRWGHSTLTASTRTKIPGCSIGEEVDFLLNEHVKELEERRCWEPNDILVVTVYLADEHPTKSLKKVLC